MRAAGPMQVSPAFLAPWHPAGAVPSASRRTTALAPARAAAAQAQQADGAGGGEGFGACRLTSSVAALGGLACSLQRRRQASAGVGGDRVASRGRVARAAAKRAPAKRKKATKKPAADKAAEAVSPAEVQRQAEADSGGDLEASEVERREPAPGTPRWEWTKRGYNCEAAPGFVARVGPEAGMGRWEDNLLVPVVPSKGTGDLTGFHSPMAPSVHLDGAADAPRGPRFSLLPPPADSQDGIVSTTKGAGQFGLRSRLDLDDDLRLKGALRGTAGGTIGKAKTLDPMKTVNFVPEPFARAQRDDQMRRPVSSALRYEKHQRVFERTGTGFSGPATATNQMLADIECWDAARLQKMCFDYKLPVSGSRTELAARIYKYSRICFRHSVTLAELSCLAASVGINLSSGAGFSPEVEKDKLDDAMRRQSWQGLTARELRYECAYRKLDTAGSEDDLRTRLQLDLKDVITVWAGGSERTVRMKGGEGRPMDMDMLDEADEDLFKWDLEDLSS